MSPVEGISSYVSPEWMQATSTGFLALALAIWAGVAEASLWRRRLWRVHGGSFRMIAEELGGQIVPLWRGWRVVSPRVTVEWREGVLGASTTIRRDGKKILAEDGLYLEDVVAPLSR
jgi:hypothetical protein